MAIEPLRKVKRLRTIARNYHLEAVTVFQRTVHGFKLDGSVNKFLISDSWYEVYQGKFIDYPKPLGHNESVELFTDERIKTNLRYTKLLNHN